MAFIKSFPFFKRSSKTIENQPETPPERADKPKFLTQTRFDSFNLPEPIIEGLNTAGFIYCSPIQAQSLPVSLAGQDVAGQAQTGTGKTAAFLVTVFSRLMAMKDRKPGVPAAVIVAPTRELAQQIYDEAHLMGAKTGLTMVQVVGGIDYVKQADILRKGVDIVICTPGRIIDYMKQGIFKANGVKIVVIDEADRLLDLGFEKDMRFLLRKMPKYDQRQSMLFSATLSHRVMELTYEYMNLPEFISVTPEEIAVKNIEQELFHVGKDEKLSLLLGLLKREEWRRMLIFVNTKMGVEWLTQKLKGNGWPAEGITGDLPQKKRFRLMDQYKSGKLKILIATDVASRGIHVEDITHVINFDLPQDPENYVHRIGRTARAGKKGRALSLACERYVFHLKPLEDLLEYQIPVVWPEDSWFAADQAGPVATERRPKKGSRPPHPKNQARDRGRQQTRGRGRQQAPRRRHDAGMPKRPKDYFPGTFFGFKPKSQMEKESVAKAGVQAGDKKNPNDSHTTQPKTTSAARKRRRPYRGRRRQPQPRKNAPVKSTPPDLTKDRSTTGKSTSEKAAPEGAAPVQTSQGKSTSKRSTPKTQTPGKAASMKRAPRERPSGKADPGKAAPRDKTSGKAVSEQTAPLVKTPDKAIASQPASGEKVPGPAAAGQTAPAKKTPPRKAAARKRPPRKRAPGKAAAKKTAPRKKAAAKKAAPKKTAARKTASRKAATKKTASRKAAPKKAASRKAAPKKAASRKAAPKKAAPGKKPGTES